MLPCLAYSRRYDPNEHHQIVLVTQLVQNSISYGKWYINRKKRINRPMLLCHFLSVFLSAPIKTTFKRS